MAWRVARRNQCVADNVICRLAARVMCVNACEYSVISAEAGEVTSSALPLWLGLVNQPPYCSTAIQRDRMADGQRVNSDNAVMAKSR